jgi:hypothetical protein
MGDVSKEMSRKRIDAEYISDVIPAERSESRDPYITALSDR